jgi:phosphoribulokinase
MKSIMDRIKKSGRVLVFGIAGDSGSGKTTISRGIKRILDEEMVCSFSMDDYHSLDQNARKERNITPLHPEANHLELLADHLELLRLGRSIAKIVYDHSKGEISRTVQFGPDPVIIVEGLHPFSTERLRSLIDFKIFVDPSRSVKRLWMVRRDVGERAICLNRLWPRF